MINVRRLALVGSIAVLSAVAVTPKAQAQSATVDFTGTVPANCTINSKTNGTFGIVNDTFYSANSATGTKGTINITCNTNVTFTVASIIDNGSDAGLFSSLNDLDASVADGATLVAAGQISPSGTRYQGPIVYPINTAGTVLTGPITNKTYDVDMGIARAAKLKGGNYNIRANIVLTPQ